jgi:hypothetical protein
VNSFILMIYKELRRFMKMVTNGLQFGHQWFRVI